MTSVLALKNLNRNKFQFPYHFYVESRLGQILHTRLRIQCSALHAGLYHKNKVESTSCYPYGGFRSAYHIFFYFPTYAATKSYLPDNLHEYSLYTLLYGTEHGTCHENTTLLLKI